MPLEAGGIGSLELRLQMVVGYECWEVNSEEQVCLTAELCSSHAPTSFSEEVTLLKAWGNGSGGKELGRRVSIWSLELRGERRHSTVPIPPQEILL